MAKKIKKVLKLQIKGGAANPAPPLGPALGQAGASIGEFVKQFNAATADKKGDLMSVVVTVFDDRSFDFLLKTPPVSSMILKKLGLKSGSGKNTAKKVGKLTSQQLREIAEEKMPDLSAASIEAAMKTIAGTARSMGIETE